MRIQVFGFCLVFLCVAALATDDTKSPLPKAASQSKNAAGQPKAVPAKSKPAQARKHAPHPKAVSAQVEPTKCALQGKWASQSLVVTGKSSTGKTFDVTGEAKFSSANPKIAVVGADGVVRPVADGETSISVVAGGAKTQVPVSVKEIKDETIPFACDVMPFFSKLGCNATACHGTQAGKGGLKLSLFGGGLNEDYAALTLSAAGRHVNKMEPAKSLFLLEATGSVPHGGGKKLKAGSPEHNMLVAWIAQGARRGDEKEPKLASLKLSADELLLQKGDSRRLLATGVLSDGSAKDMTRRTVFATTDEKVATVSANGEIMAEGPGECAITAIAARQSAAVRVVIPQHLPQPFPQVAVNNKIDELALAKLKKLGIPPSDLCTDQEFFRRIYLDTTGLLPTPEEVRTFLADKDPKKRSKLIDALMAREEFVDYWTMKWGDLFRIKSEYPVNIWPKAVTCYYRWLRDSVSQNKPYDRFVRELMTTNGSNFRRGPANFLRAVSRKDPQTIAETTAMVLMGTRIGCARCHAHPTENWSVTDDMGLAAFFAKVGYKSTGEWKEEIVYFNPKAAMRDPRTGEIVKPQLLNDEVMEMAPDEDPRVKFADWLISPKNPLFNKTVANRVWFWLMDRGIIHEPDDIRPTNLPENPELLDYLVQELVSHNYDLRHLIRLVLNSRTYQLSSKTNEWNKNDTAHFSHYFTRRLAAESVVDAVCQVTEVPETYTSSIPEPYTRLPSDYRAVQVFDGNINTNTLELFGRPPRDTPFACERNSAPSLRQKLYLINSDQLENKVSNSPRIRRLVQDKAKTDVEIVEEFYLSILSRPPTDQEKQKALTHVGKDVKTRPQAVQDVVWVLLNTEEFLFNR